MDMKFTKNKPYSFSIVTVKNIELNSYSGQNPLVLAN